MTTALRCDDGMVVVMNHHLVALKIIAGRNGDKASALAAMIREWIKANERVPGYAHAVDLARQCNFGDRNSLVVVSPGGVCYDGDEEISDRYEATFNQSDFNPYHPNGIGGICERVEF